LAQAETLHEVRTVLMGMAIGWLKLADESPRPLFNLSPPMIVEEERSVENDVSGVAGCSAFVPGTGDYYTIMAKAAGALDPNTGDANGLACSAECSSSSGLTTAPAARVLRGRYDENENYDDRHRCQTKADESIFARGQVAFGHGSPPVGAAMIQRTGVAKISHHANKRRPSTRRGDPSQTGWLLRPPGLVVRNPSAPAAVHQPSEAAAGAIQNHPPPHIIGLRPPSRSPPPWRPQFLGPSGGAISLASSGQAQALQASCGLHGHRVQLSARRCAIRACGASQRLAEPQVRGRG
jgi:hypothetical protein